MSNCLVTKLTEVVDGDGFIYLDKLVFKAPSSGTYGFGVQGIGITLDVEGSGSIQYTSGTSVQLPYTPPSGYMQALNFVASSNSSKLVINNKYSLQKFSSSFGDLALLSPCKNLVYIGMTAIQSGYIGSIEKLAACTLLETVSFESTTAVDGNVEALVNLSAMSILNLRLTRCTGSLNVLADGLAPHKTNGSTLRVQCNDLMTLDGSIVGYNVYKLFTFDGIGGWTVETFTP